MLSPLQHQPQGDPLWSSSDPVPPRLFKVVVWWVWFTKATLVVNLKRDFFPRVIEPESGAKWTQLEGTQS
jgi:hypothetical protein